MDRRDAPASETLLALAEGRLPLAERARLAAAAATDPGLARELKLALRLADGSAELARDWVAVAARDSARERSAWWRPALAMAASLGVVALVAQLPRERAGEEAAVQADNLASIKADLPDHLSAPSFESGELFGGSFESGNG